MENNSQAIELKGIVRNQTKIGVQDGQCDDIVNLRFKDGSWRVADDGKVMLDADNGEPFNVSDYSQLYVHTNVYHHLLGVKQGKLYWFANIGADGESFTLLSPVEICDVQGDVTIVQNGHLLTITCNIDQQDQNKIYYTIFKSGANEYKVLNVNANGESGSRELYPFGRIHINMDCEFSEDKNFVHEDTSAGKIDLDTEDINYNDSGALVPKNNDTSYAARQIWHSSMLKVFNDAKEANVLTQPILATVAVKLYDGSYMYASNPVMLFPREKYSTYKLIHHDGADQIASDKFFQTNGCRVDTSKTVTLDMEGILPNTTFYEIKKSAFQYSSLGIEEASYLPIYTNGAYAYRRITTTENNLIGVQFKGHSILRSDLRGYDILLTLGDLSNIINNVDVFQGLCLFVTKEADIYNLSADGYKKAEIKAESEKVEFKNGQSAGINSYTLTGNIVYRPEIRDDKEIIHDLINSPFYLLREYSVNELKSMANTSTKVDLSGVKYKGVLKNIEQQDTLPSEVFGRNDFMPKVVYQYNQRLHIANYKSNQFHGYPIDCFQLSNHSVKVENGSYAVGGVLPNLKDGVDVQYSRSKYQFLEHSPSLFAQYIQASKDKGYCFASIRVIIETQQGDQQVVRYIQPYEAHKFTNGDNANFVESLCPLITFPDYRAKEIEVAVISLHEGKVYRRSETFKLTQHPYLNIAYYIDPQLKPIDLPIVGSSTGVDFNDFITNSQIGLFVTPSERNNTEDYPNGLKVSAINNPFFFPYETTYQVGSSEIVAIMSNAVAVGTGQTGAAPLYVFCKDGIYALLVDSTGEMTYTNARIIARDVCNNAKSVTPIDNGVVFTTDRGLMSIAGSEVVEIGSAAEGDVFDITDTSDKAKKIMFNAFTMQQLAEFPEGLIGNTDFLTYLKGAIINYNHNERELMVSNPSQDYTYVMDRNGNWSRRAFTAQEYVNNYPTSYRVDNAGNFYKVDTDDNDTNKVYLLSNVIKLGTIAFKQIYRLVVRGYFETDNDSALGIYVFSSSSGNKWKLVGGNEKSGKFSDIGCKVSHEDIRFLRVCIAGKLSKDTRIDYIEVSADGSALNGKLR